MDKKLYVLIRKDLDRFGQSYKYVQGMHAVARFASSHLHDYEYQTMVVLDIGNKWKMEEWKSKLEDQGKTFEVFREPDIENELTAIACYDNGVIFKKLKLAQGDYNV